MRLLLDTHAFLWFVLNSPRLSQNASRLIQDPANDILISPASYWELAIKVSLGKYQVPEPFQSWMERQLTVNSFDILPIAVSHAAVVATLPFHHRDPFDRLMCSQALAEEIPMISVDTVFDEYGVERRW